MFDFLLFMFTGIGFVIALIGIGYGVTTLAEKIQEITKRREERINRLTSALERIEINTRKPTNG